MTILKSMLLGGACALPLYGVMTTIVYAQDQDEEVANEAFTDEIRVTARMRDERLQDVPVAVTALTEEQIRERGIEGVADYVKYIPNVSFDNALSQSTNFLTIRGQTQSQFAPPPAAIVVDGVLTLSPLQFNLDDIPFQQIEVLKGPQGAVYGRNAIGGAINITTRKPGDAFEAELLASYRRGNEYKVKGYAALPIIEDKLHFGANVVYSDRDGQVENITTGDEVDHLENFVSNLRVIAKPTDSVELDLRYSYRDTDGYDPTYVVTTTNDPDGDSDPVSSNRMGDADFRLHDLSGKLSVETPYGDMTFILAYVDTREILDTIDFEFGPLDLIRSGVQQFEDGFSQEVRFASHADKPLRWLIGGYHAKTKRDLTTEIFLNPSFFFMDPSLPNTADTLLGRAQDVNRYENYSVFGQVEYDLFEGLAVAFAGRYDHDTLTQNNVEEIQFEKFQPKGTITYRVNPELLVYASAGRGYRVGDFNAGGASFGAPIIKAEEATSYEIGLKSQPFDRNLTLNMAGYYTSLENGQVKVFDAVGATEVGVNVDKVRIYGFEIEAIAHLSEYLSVNGAFGYTHEEVTAFTPPPGLSVPSSAVVGQVPPRIPDYTFNTGMNFEYPVSAGASVVLRSNYRRVGEYFWDLANDFQRSAVNYLDIRAGLSDADGHWSLTGFVENALNDKTTGDFQPAAVSGHPLGIDAYYWAVGTVWGVELGYRF